MSIADNLGARSSRMIEHFCRVDFIRFACVGAIATFAQWGILAFLVELLDVNPIVSSATSYLLSSLLNYLMNYHFTFASSKSHLVAMPQFFLVVAIGLAINTGTFAILSPVSAHYLIAQAGATLAALVANFAFHKFWIYRS